MKMTFQSKKRSGSDIYWKIVFDYEEDCKIN